MLLEPQLFEIPKHGENVKDLQKIVQEILEEGGQLQAAQQEEQNILVALVDKFEQLLPLERKDRELKKVEETPPSDLGKTETGKDDQGLIEEMADQCQQLDDGTAAAYQMAEQLLSLLQGLKEPSAADVEK
ncbi:hypothetical protein [Parachlamydia sp. AcF125]|uniref:hypothetical protein n=1 Tax=Parachlamydia sp. AcF125 TaxID=2795736 RepID=UPI001BC98BD6|nr:hypothetical protein [Parachlamydia sp. AcF125]MBS4167552.1 hypothetical protein [Parachlamydia sp. AcF125]